MTTLVFAAALVAAAVLGLWANARDYVRHAELRWPRLGRSIETHGVHLHIAETGREGAPRLLLIHGASSNLRELWGPIGALANEFRIVAYDRPGMGYSERPRKAAQTLAVQAAVAADVLRATGGGPAIIVAHSYGAGVALRLAHAHPDLVTGLVLIAPAANTYEGANAWWVDLAAAPLIGPLFAGGIVPAVAPVVSRGGLVNLFAPAPAPDDFYEDGGVGLAFRPIAFRSSAQDVRVLRRELAAQSPTYPDIFAPTIIVTADKDRVVSPKRHARALAAAMPAAELVIAPGAGHMPHRVRPDLVLTAIRRVADLASQRGAE